MIFFPGFVLEVRIQIQTCVPLGDVVNQAGFYKPFFKLIRIAWKVSEKACCLE